jgi:hypothetical protein
MVKHREQQRRVDRDHDCDGASAVACADVGAVGHGCSTPTPLGRCETFIFGECAPGANARRNHADREDQRLELLLRPPPWLALPPLLAISRCFSGSIAANPRFDRPLLFVAMSYLPSLE